MWFYILLFLLSIILIFRKKIWRVIEIILLIINTANSIVKGKTLELNQSFTIINNKAVKISFSHLGMTQHIFVPYHPFINNIQVELINGENKMDITQPIGIPLLVSAEDLGGEKILITHLDNDNKKEFVGTEIPILERNFFN